MHSRDKANIQKSLKTVFLFGLICLTANLSSIAVAAEEKVLNVYNWADYIAPDTISNFQKETGIRVRYDNYDGNETLHAKLVAGKSGYDIVVPASSWAKIQLQGGLLQKLDKTQLPNWQNLDPVILTQLSQVDPGNQYLVSWLWGYTTVGVNMDKVKTALGNTPMPDNAWELVFNPQYTHKLKGCGLGYLDSGSEVFPAVLHYLGKPAYSNDKADYTAAFDVLKKVRGDIKVFTSLGQIEDIANGSVCVVLGWVGDFNLAHKRSIENKKPKNIVALVPANGGVMFMDTMAIPADAPHPHNAHLFINYILNPKVHASLTNAVTYANPNKAATPFVDADIKNNPSIYLSPTDISHLVPPDTVDNNTRRTITRLFTRFKSGL